jgi:EAL domain-containing protein (putative c-di-GMP-specific phosphodiesterase class I)
LPSVSVNISGQQLERENFVKRLKAILLETGCNPHWLELEMTESGSMDAPPQQTLEKLQALHDLGL